METLNAALLYPGSYNAVVRWDQSSLKDTTWGLLREIIQVSGLDIFIKRETNSIQQSYIDFTNGSRIQGFHAKSWKKFGGLPLSSFFIDEIAELEDDEAYNQLCARVERSPIGPHRGWVCGLPDGHNWVWRKFCQNKLPDHEFFGGTSYDNPFLIDGYADRMIEQYGPVAGMAMVMGSFDAIEGRLFTNFDYKTHVIPRTPFPADYPRYAAVDPGFNPDPAAMLRVVVDPHGNIIVEAEYERTDRITEQWAQDIIDVNKDNPPQWYVIDKTAYRQDHSSPISVAELARRTGISPIREASNHAGYIDQAVSIIRSLLSPAPNRTHPITKQKGIYPQLYIMESCPLAIREINNFRMKKAGVASMYQGIKVPDHDHDLCDCLCWLCLEYLPPAVGEQKPVMSDFWLEVLEERIEEPRPYIEQISRMNSRENRQSDNNYPMGGKIRF